MTTPSKMRICVAIPTYLREELLVATVEQVLAQNPPADEVIIIDQTPQHSPETELFLREKAWNGSVRWLHQKDPNLPRARNRALRESACDIVIFVDDDVRLSAGFVAHHAANYVDKDTVAVAGQTIQKKTWKDPPRTWARQDDYRYLALDAEERQEGIASFRGCNHSIRREAVLAVGGYDEGFIGWAFREDSDLALRLWKGGRKIVFDPRASLVHLSAPTGGCRFNFSVAPLPEWAISFPAHYFMAKHFYPSATYWHQTLIGNFRRYALRKHNVVRPWRLPWACWSYGYSAIRALQHGRKARVAATSSDEPKKPQNSRERSDKTESCRE